MASWISRRMAIVFEIRATIDEVKRKELEIDEKKFIEEISLKYGCSKRTAKDYLEAAKLRKPRYIK